MTSDVFGMSDTDVNVQAVPRTVVTLGATGTTRMRIQVSRLLFVAIRIALKHDAVEWNEFRAACKSQDRCLVQFP